MTQHIETLFAAWGESDPEKRAEVLRSSLASEFYYADPNAPAPISDADAFVSYVAQFSEHAPGATVKVVHLSECKGHHRATVAFEMPNGFQQLGQYFIELDHDGRAARLIGFAGTGVPE